MGSSSHMRSFHPTHTESYLMTDLKQNYGFLSIAILGTGSYPFLLDLLESLENVEQFLEKEFIIEINIFKSKLK
jgi:hypothetical protein